MQKLQPKPTGDKYTRVVRLLRKAAWHVEQAWKCAREAQANWDGCFPEQGGAHSAVKRLSGPLQTTIRAGLKRLTGTGDGE